MSLVALNMPYFPDPSIGRPVALGSIYVGEPDLDPEILANQKTISIRQEDGTEVPVSQPVLTGAGGIPMYAGSPVQILVDGDYSLKVLNKHGSQVYYIDSAVNLNPASVLNVFGAYDTIADLRDAAIYTNANAYLKGYSTVGDGGEGNFLWYPSDLSTEVAADTQSGIYVAPTSDLTGASGAWVRQYDGSVNVKWFGITESTTSAATWQGMIDLLVIEGVNTVRIPHWNIGAFDGEVDCKGIALVCDDATISIGTSNNTFVNYKSITGTSIAGIDVDKAIVHPSSSVNFNFFKALKRLDADSYLLYSPKIDPSEGVLEYRVQKNYVTATNSLGVSSNYRVVDVRNITDLITLKHTYDSTTVAVPSDSVTRQVGTGTSAANMAFWKLLPGESVTFSPGTVVDELSISFLLTVSSSPDVDISFDGVSVDTVSLVQGAGGADYMLHRVAVSPGNGNIVITNNSGSLSAYCAGVNAYHLTDVPSQIDADTVCFSRAAYDFMSPGSAIDYAFHRHSDDYAGTMPTGGSYHGGETVVSDNWYLDGYLLATPAIGDIVFGRRILHSSNVNIIWDDAEEINVVRLNEFGDGVLRSYVDADTGGMVFDNVWTMMWNPDVNFDAVRDVAAGEIVVDSAKTSYQRTNRISLTDGVNKYITNTFTLFDNERNTTGGPYVNDTTAKKIYYGPILFNKGVVGEIHSLQVTEFYGT